MIYFCRPKRVLLASTRHPDGFSWSLKYVKQPEVIIILGQYMPIQYMSIQYMSIIVNILSQFEKNLRFNYSKLALQNAVTCRATCAKMAHHGAVQLNTVEGTLFRALTETIIFHGGFSSKPWHFRHDEFCFGSP